MYTQTKTAQKSVNNYSLNPGYAPVLASCQAAPFYGMIPRVVSGSEICITLTWEQMRSLVTCYCHRDKNQKECQH